MPSEHQPLEGMNSWTVERSVEAIDTSGLAPLPEPTRDAKLSNSVPYLAKRMLFDGQPKFLFELELVVHVLGKLDRLLFVARLGALHLPATAVGLFYAAL